MDVSRPQNSGDSRMFGGWGIAVFVPRGCLWLGWAVFELESSFGDGLALRFGVMGLFGGCMVLLPFVGILVAFCVSSSELVSEQVEDDGGDGVSDEVGLSVTDTGQWIGFSSNIFFTRAFSLFLTGQL